MSATAKNAGNPVERAAQEAIQEARMVLPGIQGLFGFQLVTVFSERFRQLSQTEQIQHFVAIVLSAVAIALIMTPAAYHRQVHPGTVDSFFVKLASRFTTAAMVPLMIGLCLDIHLLARIVLGSPSLSVAIALTLIAMFTALWFVFPYVMRQWRGKHGVT